MGLTRRKESLHKVKKAGPRLKAKKNKKTVMSASELMDYLKDNNITLATNLLKVIRRQEHEEPKVQEYLSTQEIADILNVSRPYVVKLLDAKKIPSHKVGNQRRVQKEIVYAYKNELLAEQEKALQELAEKSAKLGLEY